ncbi:unnamed protein product [Phytophthora fragariaefolia]|uniref:Unnamed protein product n=1 Tax=Phytophthora fragariaefolia TaxID=1490495 RepID=A0A9W7CG71_9STRA|nr:unnamed protein product [Phytophthora fragariaefolia]
MQSEGLSISSRSPASAVFYAMEAQPYKHSSFHNAGNVTIANISTLLISAQQVVLALAVESHIVVNLIQHAHKAGSAGTHVSRTVSRQSLTGMKRNWHEQEAARL